jgi:glycerophosphoryl diester phosphodiesterase
MERPKSSRLSVSKALSAPDWCNMVTRLIHHKADCGGDHVPSGLAALRGCVRAGVEIAEIDIIPIRDGDFLLAHDARLEEFSDGKGPVAALTAAEARGLHYLGPSGATDEPLGLLSEALPLLGEGPMHELQLDLKLQAGLTAAALAGLAARLAPVRGRVRVSCVADWALRALHRLDPVLPLGFDPLLYLDVERVPPEQAPPHRTGAYGYLDDHPLALYRWGSTADYLAARAEALWAQAPMAGVWYIRASLLARALDDGFDWIAWLHAQGAEVAAWTLNPGQPHQLILARQLAAAGVDRITTDDVSGLAFALGSV